jgi:hypothetical protein
LVPHFTEKEEKDPSEEFMSLSFKTQWCPIGGPHDWENCVYAHTYRDWRRVPVLGYSSRPCPQWAQSVARGSPDVDYDVRCPRGMGCPLAHGCKEQLYHPSFYKTSQCVENNCKRGVFCAFTHGEFDQKEPASAEDPSTRVNLEAIPNFEEVLAHYQPTFSEPPNYHALEDSSRVFVQGRTKGGGKKNAQKAAPVPRGPPPAAAAEQGDFDYAEAAPAPHMGPAAQGMRYTMDLQQTLTQDNMQSGMAAAGSTGAPYGMHMCQWDQALAQWTPCTEAQAQASAQMMPGPMGFDPQYQTMMWNQAMAQWPPMEMDGSPTFDTSIFDLDMQQQMSNADVEAEFAAGLPMIPIDQSTHMQFMRFNKDNFMDTRYRTVGGGYRTPSSFGGSMGSVPQSATPTEVPSPRVDENTGTSTGSASSDRAPVPTAGAEPEHAGKRERIYTA